MLLRSLNFTRPFLPTASNAASLLFCLPEGNLFKFTAERWGQNTSNTFKIQKNDIIITREEPQFRFDNNIEFFLKRAREHILYENSSCFAQANLTLAEILLEKSQLDATAIQLLRADTKVVKSFILQNHGKHEKSISLMHESIEIKKVYWEPMC